MFIKTYCSPSEKKKIESEAVNAGYSSTSAYLKDKAFSDNINKATLVELVSCMVKLIEAKELPTTTKDDLFEIAQAVLDGQSVSEGRKRISEVCSLASQSNERE